jgi:beta-lactamase regulating signal transducer with metallopeptidase domain
MSALSQVIDFSWAGQHAFLAALFDVAIKASVVLAAAWITNWIMRRSSAAARHMVWTLAITSLLLIPALSAVLPAWRVLPEWSRLPKETVVPAMSPVPVAVESRIEAIATTPKTSLEEPEEASPQPLTTAKAPTPIAAESITAATSPPVHIPWVFMLWLVGATLAFLPVVLGSLALRRLRKRSTPLTDAAWRELLGRCQDELRRPRYVRLLVSDTPSMPMTWGILRPTILLPAECNAWPTQRRRAVLLHELAHVKRRDCLWQLLVHLTCAAYWFNPLVWLARAAAIRQREQACDDLVLACGTTDTDYAEQILQVASGFAAPRLTAATGIPMARASQLEGRLMAILDRTRNRKAMTWGGIVVAMLIVVAFVLPVTSLRAKDGEKKQPDKPADILEGEVTLNDPDDDTKSSFIDFDERRAVDCPVPWIPKDAPPLFGAGFALGMAETLQRTVREQRLDLFSDASGRSLMAMDMVTVSVSNEQFDAPLSKIIGNPLLDGPATKDPGSIGAILHPEKLPATYVFKTREGGRGVLQILSFSDKPVNVRIRYKVAKPDVQKPTNDTPVPATMPASALNETERQLLGNWVAGGFIPGVFTFAADGRYKVVSLDTVLATGRWSARNQRDIEILIDGSDRADQPGKTEILHIEQLTDKALRVRRFENEQDAGTAVGFKRIPPTPTTAPTSQPSGPAKIKPAATGSIDVPLPTGGAIRLLAMLDARQSPAKWWKPDGSAVEPDPQWQRFAAQRDDGSLGAIVEIVYPAAAAPAAKIGPAGEEFAIPFLTAVTIDPSLLAQKNQLLLGVGTGAWRDLGRLEEGQTFRIGDVEAKLESLDRSQLFASSVKGWYTSFDGLEIAWVAEMNSGEQKDVAPIWFLRSGLFGERKMPLLASVLTQGSKIDHVMLRGRERSWVRFDDVAPSVAHQTNPTGVLLPPAPDGISRRTARADIAPVPAHSPTVPPFTQTFSDGMAIELLGVRPRGDERIGWQSPGGSGAISMPYHKPIFTATGQRPTDHLAFRIANLPSGWSRPPGDSRHVGDLFIQSEIDAPRSWSGYPWVERDPQKPQQTVAYYVLTSEFPGPTDNVRLYVAGGAWEHVGEIELKGGAIMGSELKPATGQAIRIESLEGDERRTAVFATGVNLEAGWQVRVVAFDVAGKPCKRSDEGPMLPDRNRRGELGKWVFEAPFGTIGRLRVERRQLHIADFKDFHLKPTAR